MRRLTSRFAGDTITIPTDSMLVAGIQASRGDDVYHDDEATSALEKRIAKLTGKEAALFVVSGTMSNREHLQRSSRLYTLAYPMALLQSSQSVRHWLNHPIA